jgi:hypothetical protein
MAYTNTNTERSIKNINGDVELISVNVQNDETIGINTEVTKENTSGAGFASNVYGVNRWLARLYGNYL